MGGHSIKAVQVMIEIQKQTGKEFPLSALFQ
jgi:acyl carrier protein